MSTKSTPKKDAISALVTAMAGQENVIAVNRFFVDLTGTLEAAILLSQIIYWSDRTTMDDSWFAKSYEDWQKEICLSKYQVTKSIKVLETLGVETKLKKFNGSPTVHYRLKMEVFRQSIVNFLTNDSEETSQSITETTAETTKETTFASPDGNAVGVPKIEHNETLPDGMIVIQSPHADPNTSAVIVNVGMPPPDAPQQETKKEPEAKKFTLKDHVIKIWGPKYEGMAGSLLAQMLGITKADGMRKTYNFEEPLINAIELWGFRYWWRANYPDIPDMPTKAETLSERFAQFRGAPDYTTQCGWGKLAYEQLTGEVVDPEPEILPTPEPVQSSGEVKNYKAEIDAAIHQLAEQFKA